MTTRCSSDQGLFDVAEVDREKADSVDVRNPGANPRDVVKVHVDEIAIAELAMLGPHSSAYSGNPRPISEAAPGYHSVGRSLLGNHGRIDRALDIRLAVGALPEMLRTLHRVCQCLDQARIESSRPVLDVLLFGLAARSDLRRSVFGKFGGHLKAHTERRSWCYFYHEMFEWREGKKILHRQRKWDKGRQMSQNSRGFPRSQIRVVGHRTAMRQEPPLAPLCLLGIGESRIK